MYRVFYKYTFCLLIQIVIFLVGDTIYDCVRNSKRAVIKFLDLGGKPKSCLV